MNRVVSNWLGRVFDPAWLARQTYGGLAGPIFDKELRVASRRRRNYVLRFLYIAFFAVLLSAFWAEIVAPGATSTYQASRMAQMGQQIIAVVVWFQFLMTQVVALVMLSTAISDEIYHRTLGVLMTTPIAGGQIVLGKLLSKLLQLLLLLGIALPLLAVVRVFGGVPWDFLLCSLGVTLTTVLFVGALSLFFSIFTRRAYVTIIATVLTLGLLFAFLPLILVLVFPTISRVFGGAAAQVNWERILSYINPYFMMAAATGALARARPVGPSGWLVHCGIALGAAALLLLAAVICVRRAALAQIAGTSVERRLFRNPRPARRIPSHVAGSPVFWKERRAPLLGRRGSTLTVILLAAVSLLILSYVLCADNGLLDHEEVHAAYVIVFTGLGMLFTVVIPATCITSEKESQAWPLLLTTTLGDGQIVWGKLQGALYRCLPAWAPLFGHVLVFTLAGRIHPVALLQLAILVAWIMIFLSSTGLYFSAQFRHTTTAVIANMALAAGLWAVVPILLGIALVIAEAGDDLLEVYMDFNPFVHAGVITVATAQRGGIAAYSWLQAGGTDWAGATAWIALNCTVYVLIGLIFVALAGSQLRRKPV